MKKLLFIGGGNMARSIIGGLLADGYAAEKIQVVDPAEDASSYLSGMGVAVYKQAGDVIAAAEVVIFAVKPQMLKSVAEELATDIQQNKPLIVSVAAGVRSGDLNSWLGGGLGVVRSMPNTPALVCSGATGLYANAGVDKSGKELAESIMRAVGMTLWVDDEAQMDAVTALSGSGPAYVFLVMEAMQRAAEDLGLESKTAKLLTLQTVLGAAKLAMESSESVEILRQRVTSPGGTTEQGIKQLEDNGLRQAFSKALAAAKHRSEELAKLLGE